MIYKQVIGNELYVWMCGSLLYKRWLLQGHGMVFCNKWGNRPFRASDIISIKPI